ncbi:TPA: hypothetical protein QDB43_000323 [Burkholderia vietnamiensis]|nr:hypothetical protein [Burkholderia vietnamiensis]
MSTTKSVFPVPAARTTNAAARTRQSGKLGMKATTRANITPAYDLGIDSKALQGEGFGRPAAKTAAWPGNLNMVPNAMARCALFGCARRTAGTQNVVRERVLASSDQYRVTYVGVDLDQNDCEVWELALAWCRQSGKKMGERVYFTFNDWCRILERPESHGVVNDLIIQSLERLMGAFLKIETSQEDGWVHVIDEVGRDKTTGRAYVTINHKVAPWLAADATEIDLKRKVKLKSTLAKWMHDYYSTSSSPFAMNLSTLMERSGSADIPMRNFRIRVVKAVEELQQCEPPLFAPETRVAKKGNGEYALFVEKETNSRIVPPKREALEAPAEVALPEQPAAPQPQPVPVATPMVTLKKPRLNAYGELEIRSAAEIQAAHQRARVAL